MYYKLRGKGITSQIDENIGIEFMNLDLVMAANSHASSQLYSNRSSGSLQEETESSKFE